MADNKETVRYDVIVELKTSLEALRKMSDSSRTNEQRIKTFADTVVSQSKRMNVSLESLYKQYEKLNRAAVAKDKKEGFGEIMGKGGIFGAGGMGGMFGSPLPSKGGQGVINSAKAYNDASIAAQRLSVTQEGIVTSTKKATTAQAGFGAAAESNANKAKKGFDGLRIAVSIMAYDLVRTGIQAVTTFFTQAITKAKELESSLYRLQNAERILSQEGIDVSMGGFKKGIQDIKKLLPIFSEKDITEMMGALAVSTKQLGLTEDQLTSLARAAAIYNVQSVENETLLQSQAKLVTALISPAAKSIGDYGISFGKVTMEAKALELGILRVGESVAKLTDAQKAQVKYAIIMEGADSNLANLNDFMETNTAKIEKNKAAWEDLQTVVGEAILPFIPAVTTILDFLEGAINGSKILIALAASWVGMLSNTAAALASGKIGIKNLVEYAKFAFTDLKNQWLQSFFPDIPADAPDFVKKLLDSAGIGKFEDTATAATELQDSLDSIDTSKAQDELKDMLKDLENLKENIDEKEADYGVDLARFDEDALQDRQRAVEDYNLNVLQATRSFNTSKKEANEKYHQKELEEERKFQEDMRKLQEDFLYSLEDALRERDARQVLRLIDKYEMDKTAMQNENALRKQSASENKAAEDADRKAQLDEKLRTMAEEQTLKMQRMDEDSALKRQRMEEDHALEMERLRAQLDERIQEAATKMAEEYGVNEEGAKAIYDLLNQYYGSDGALAQLTGDGYNAMLNQASGFLSGLEGIIGQYQNVMSQMASTPMSTPYYPAASYMAPTATGASSSSGGGGHTAGALAGGGQFLATRPTSFLAGESGKEQVTVTPLSQIGKDGSNGFGGINGENGQTQIYVRVDLSPDLEARVVNRAMEGTAQVISTVSRSKR